MTARVLMSEPRFAPALGSERSWTPDETPLDQSLAIEQWHRLVELVGDNIAPVALLPPEPWAPAMTFTRDLALAAGEAVIPLMPHGRRGPFEAPLAHQHMAWLGYRLCGDEPMRLDGGNVLADFHDRLLIGVSDEPGEHLLSVVRDLEAQTGRIAHKVPIAGGRFPHIDMALCDLGGTAWLVYPQALPGFDLADPAWAALFLGRPVVAVEAVDGERLGCNLVVHEQLAIGPEISAALRLELARNGIDYLETPLTELIKAGGGAHCLTLELPGQTWV